MPMETGIVWNLGEVTHTKSLCRHLFDAHGQLVRGGGLDGVPIRSSDGRPLVSALMKGSPRDAHLVLSFARSSAEMKLSDLLEAALVADKGQSDPKSMAAKLAKCIATWKVD